MVTVSFSMEVEGSQSNLGISTEVSVSFSMGNEEPQTISINMDHICLIPEARQAEEKTRKREIERDIEIKEEGKIFTSLSYNEY